MLVSSLRDGSESLCIYTNAATTNVRMPRKKSMATIIFLRSTRSVITPAGRVNISQGRRDATAAKAIRNGSRVIADASQGYATVEIPSPRFEMAVALQSFQYELPSFFLIATSNPYVYPKIFG